jgi:pyridoxal phosphate enzyme (YggS family)
MIQAMSDGAWVLSAPGHAATVDVMGTRETRIAENLESVRRRIAQAAGAAGRRPQDVRLVAITKYVDSSVARMLVESGCSDLGESRPQALWEKAEACTGLSVRWHLVGRLQRNKVRRTLPVVSLIQSVDSVALLESIDAQAARLALQVAVLLEVNISGETTKQGVSPVELPKMLSAAAACTHTSVRGLMAMAALAGGPETARKNFADLRRLRDRLRVDLLAEITLEELSMGMSDDFELAIAEGATIVRVGRALFEGL